MEQKICQSCGMPLTKNEEIGTNKNGSKNEDYCVYCYTNGEFTDHIDTLEKYTEYSLQFAEQAGMTKEQMKKFCKEVLPTLKRWKN
jgi:hypothetical protein